MIPSIGISRFVAVTSDPAPVLQGMLTRYERELSACINCSTANTADGQQKIQELSVQISQIKARLEQASQSRQAPRTSAPPENVLNGNMSTATPPAMATSIMQPQSRIGSFIDIVV